MMVNGLTTEQRNKLKKYLQEDEFLVDESNIDNIRRRGYFGESVQVGDAATYIGDGFVVRRINTYEQDTNYNIER